MEHFNWARSSVTVGGAGNLNFTDIAGFPGLGTVIPLGTLFPVSILTPYGLPIATGVGHLSNETTFVWDTVFETFVSGVYDNTAPSIPNIPSGAIINTTATRQSIQEILDLIEALQTQVDNIDTGGGGGGGGSDEFLSVPFSPILDFDGINKEMAQYAITGPLAFSLSANAVLGTEIRACIVANGTNVPTFPANVKEITGSSGYDNTANVKNYYQFVYTNNKVIYSVFQEVGDTGATDITAPTLSSAVVQNATPTVVAVTYSEALDQTVTQNAADWAVSGHTVSSVAFASSTVINLTVSSAFVYGEATRTVTYTNNANRVKDLAGNAALTSSATNITNNLAAPDVTAPTLTSATVENATPTTLTLVFSEALDQTKTLSAADFTLSGSKTDSSPVYVNSTTVSMTVTAFTNGEAITLDVAAGAVRDTSNNNINAITARAITNNVASGGGDADADAFISAAGITDSTQQSAIQTLVTSLKTNSLWAKMLAIYPIVGGTSTTHKFNLKDPQDLDAAYRLGYTGGLTHSANDGITPNGTTGWVNTFLDPSAAGLTATSLHISFYQRTTTTTSSAQRPKIAQGRSGTDWTAITGTVSNLEGGSVGSGSGNSHSGLVAANNGYFVATTDGSRATNFYIDGAATGTVNTQSGSLGSGNNFALFAALDGVGVRNIFNTTEPCSFATIGTGLSATDVTNLNNAVAAFQTTLSRAAA